MWQFWLYLGLTLLTDAISIVFGKYYSLTHNKIYLALCVLGFAVTGLFFGLSLNYKGIALANMLWSAFAAILIATIGVLAFKEQISNIQFVGMAVTLLGVALINSK